MSPIASDTVYKKTSYPTSNGIVCVLKENEVQGKNLRYQKLYDRIAWCYDGVISLARLFLREGKRHPLEPFFDQLRIEPGNRVLEVSIGTGRNIRLLPQFGEYYGIDISMGMLRQARRTLRRNKRNAELAYAAAESLPFQDGVFDVVFHVGGFNFFNDKQKAIDEMIRVAKPGARLLIADETEETAKKGEKWPIASSFFKGRSELIKPPIDLIPKGMQDIRLDYTSQRTLYAVTFTKPA